MILVVTFRDNEHVERVRQHLTRPARIFDVADFPSRTSLEVRFAGLGAASHDVRVLRPAGEPPLDLDEVGAVWLRRLRPMELDPALTDPTGRLFAWSESNEALQGLWQSTECFWMNPLWADEAGQRKLRQLQVARQVGLEVPATLVTNDPALAHRFVTEAPGGVIRKAFRNIPQAPRATALVQPEDLDRVGEVAYAPVTFQEFVEADVDLRVVVVEEEVFATAIRSRPEYRTDYRAGIGSAEMTVHRLPDQVAAALVELHKRLGLVYGASDFRLTPDGRYVFLEVNPAGEYLFAVERTGQPVPQAIAACLDRHDRLNVG